MALNNKLLVLLALFVVIFSIANVSAADDAVDVINSTNDALLSADVGHSNDLSDVNDDVAVNTLNDDQEIKADNISSNISSKSQPLSVSNVDSDEKVSLGVDENDAVLGEGELYNYVDLQALIDAAPENGIINLDNDYVYNPDRDFDLQHGIKFNKTVTINGNGFAIDAQGDVNEARIFNITASHVTLRAYINNFGFFLVRWSIFMVLSEIV